MKWLKRLVVTLVLVSTGTISMAQNADSLLLSGVETDLTFEDSLSIFHLIDDLLLQGDLNASQLGVRMSYNSNVMSTGRTLGIENFGLSPGISYYHKSGLYADVSGFWSKDFDPSYYLTVASLGYMRDFTKRFSIIAGYDHYLYNVGKNNYVPYTHAVSVTPTLEFRPLVLSTTYSFYFGDANAHRILPGLSLIFEKKKWMKIDRVAITPSFFVLFGNETLIELEYVAPQTPLEAIQNFRKYGTRFRLTERTRKVFGIMNYAVSIPINVSHKNWSFSFSYAYNVPKALPGEPLALSESSYLAGSITYFIKLSRNKLSL